MVETTILTSSFTRHIVAESAVNPATKDSDFFFIKPEGSKERNQGKK